MHIVLHPPTAGSEKADAVAKEGAARVRLPLVAVDDMI